MSQARFRLVPKMNDLKADVR